MVEHGLNHLLINIDCHMEVFIRVPSHKLDSIIKVFIGVEGEGFDIQIWQYILYRFVKGI